MRLRITKQSGEWRVILSGVANGPIPVTLASFSEAVAVVRRTLVHWKTREAAA